MDAEEMDAENVIILFMIGSVILMMIAAGIMARSDHTHECQYTDALEKSIIFFEGQRSGHLPPNQTLSWRGDSGVSDGAISNIDLVGGYYVDGSNVKYGFPMAFTVTMLSWSIIEYGKLMGPNLDAAKAAIKWGSDYLLKAATQTPETLYVQVGDMDLDNHCWERPEDMNKFQNIYNVSDSNPGSDVAGETAAALAASSVVFRQSDPVYSSRLLTTSMNVFDFADRYRGSYNASNSSNFCSSNCASTGYYDELAWSSLWLYLVTQNTSYLQHAQTNSQKMKNDGLEENMFSWNDKTVGVNILLAKLFLQNKVSEFQVYKDDADRFFCSLFPGYSRLPALYSPGGLLYHRNESNMQYVTSTSFLLLTYASYLKSTRAMVFCGTSNIMPDELVTLAMKQVDYILGDNSAQISYMVGNYESYRKSYPKQIHHRGSSIPSIYVHPNLISCSSGLRYLYSTSPNPNILVGAVVGGPNLTDTFHDDRLMFLQNQPSTYINAPLVGTLAYFSQFDSRSCKHNK